MNVYEDVMGIVYCDIDDNVKEEFGIDELKLNGFEFKGEVILRELSWVRLRMGF